ncbi:MAG: DUF2306 domain-containing protein [Flavobacteriales bacterium]|nr:DUF2306 domain-containing protein [Flavobacteriales bacterium]
MKKIWINTSKSLLYALLAFFIFLMGKIVGQYIFLDTDVGFLRIKQQYLPNHFWKISFFIHSFTAIFSLLAGFTQFSKSFLKNHTQLHRVFGKLYVIIVLCLAAPSGLVLSLYANGHWPSIIGFSVLSVLWFYFTFTAYRQIRLHKFDKHEHFMIRSYALSLSAITLRLWKPLIATLFEPNPLFLYQLITWLGFVPNLVFAEILIKIKKNKKELKKDNPPLHSKQDA